MPAERDEEGKPAAPVARADVATGFRPTGDASVRVLVRLEGSSSSTEGESRRTAFWNALYSRANKEPAAGEQAPEARALKYEKNFTREFGETLRDRLLERRVGEPPVAVRRTSGRGAASTEAHQSDRGIEFWLRVGPVDYGSLTFGLIVTGAAKFLQLFDDNVDLCEAVLSSLVPETLVSASCIGSYAQDDVDAIASVEVDASSLKAFVPAPTLVVPAPTLAAPVPTESKTAPEPAKPMPKDPPSRNPGRPLLWLLNGTLLVPVLLALAVLFVAFSSVRDDKMAFTRSAEDLLSQERSALKDERAAIDAHLQRAIDREVERANFWAQMDKDLSTQLAARAPERKAVPPAAAAAITTAGPDQKTAGGLAHP